MSKESDAPIGSRRRRKRDSAAAAERAVIPAAALKVDAREDSAGKSVFDESELDTEISVSAIVEPPATHHDENMRDESVAADAISHSEDGDAADSLDELPAALRDALASAPDVLEDGAGTLQLGDPLVLSAPADIVVAQGDAAARDVDLIAALAADSTPASSIAAEEIDEADAARAEVLPFDEDGPYDEVANPAVLTFDDKLVVSPVAEAVDSVASESWQDMPAPAVERDEESAEPADNADVSENSESSEFEKNIEPDENPDEIDDIEAVASDVTLESATEESADVDSLKLAGTDREQRVDTELVAEAEPEPVVEAEPVLHAEPVLASAFADDAAVAEADHLPNAEVTADLVPAATIDIVVDEELVVDESLSSNESELSASSVDGADTKTEGLVPETETRDVDESMDGGKAALEVDALTEQRAEAEGDMGEDAPVIEQLATAPEPLVEPTPLTRSSFEPDLSKVGRPETAPITAEPLRIEPVRPLGEETMFTTADRLRASEFAPVASERVDNRPAPAAVSASEEGPTLKASEPEGHSTQPRAEVQAQAASESVTSAPMPQITEGTAPAEELDESVDTCTQCGTELSESDIFCGSCGFVKHGVGPGSRTAPPALDPFPWGIPTASKPVIGDPRHEESSSAPERSDSRADDAETDSFPSASAASVIDQADVDVDDSSEDPLSTELLGDAFPGPSETVEVGNVIETEEAIPLIEPGSEPPVPAPAVSSADKIPEASASVSHSVDEYSVTEPEERPNNPEAAPLAPPRLEAAPLLEPVSVNPAEPLNDAAAQSSSSVPAFSVLAPPPKSNQRVELPISPPAPLAAFATDDEDIEDIEDTRIVERSETGTRFVLQFSTGDSVIVTGTGLVGRNPIPEPSEKFDIVVPITDPSKSVSKTHLEFGQMSGVFWISDRYSGNGTIVREPGAEPKRCEPGKRYRVVRGTRVEIGEQFFIVS